MKVRSSTLGERYAKALLAIGVDRDIYEQLGRELDRVSVLFDIEDVRQLFRNPKFNSEVRKAVLAEILAVVTVSPICRNFLFLLVDRNRIGKLQEIIGSFHQLADKHAGRLRARVRVASPLSEADVERLRSVLQNVTGQKVVIEQEHDESIVAGVVTHIGGRVYDGSVSNQLQILRTRLKRGEA
jgi:F-type H+-transporting ATPase subunit delta